MRDKPYCKAPWVGLSYTASEGCKPCCEWKGEFFNGTHTEYLKSDYLKDFKELMFEDEMNPMCMECINLEKRQAQPSRRQKYMPYDINQGLVRLDFRPGNKCNMKCRMCGSHSSSLWEDEEQEQGQNRWGQPPEEYFDIDMSDIYDIDFSSLKKIMILGGEPSIDLEVRKFIEHIKDLDCFVGITCNASNASNKWFNSLKQIKNLSIDLSIDATGDIQDYQRTGSDWPKVKSNIIKYRDTFESVNISTTATAMNFPVIDTWWDELMDLNMQVFFSVCHYPKDMSLNAIPDDYKEEQIFWLQEWCNNHDIRKIEMANCAIKILKNSKYDPNLHQRFIHTTNYIDNIRGENIKNIDYRFEEIMNE